MIQQFLVSCLYTYDGAMCFGSTSFFSRRCSWSSSVTEIVVLENRNEGFNQVPSRFRWLNFCLIVSQSADCTFLQMGVSMNHSKSKNQVKNWSILDIVVTQTESSSSLFPLNTRRCRSGGYWYDWWIFLFTFLIESLEFTIIVIILSSIRFMHIFISPGETLKAFSICFIFYFI